LRTSTASVLLSAAALVGGLSHPCGAHAQQTGAEAFVGTWEGVLDTGTARLRLVLHVSRADDGVMSGTLDSPDQGANGIPASEVSAADGELRFAVANLGATYTARLSTDGASMSGTFMQGGAQLPLDLNRQSGDPGAAATPPNRPQNPTPPLPYDTEEVTVQSAPGVTLAGTLTLPRGAGPFPAAVLVSGSGPQDRDETVFGHKPFLVLSDHLTRAGIAVLRYDDRGIGASTGNFAAATSEDFATDALAAVAFLKARGDIGAVGVVGHSEGGLVGPMAAARSDDVDYVVMLAGPGMTGEEIVLLQGELIARAQGAPEDAIRANAEAQKRLFGVVRTEPDTAAAAVKLRAALEETITALPEAQRAQAGSPEAIEAQVRQVNSPWFRFFLTYDPRPALERVHVPILALNGGNDLQVPAEADLREVEAAFARGRNPDATARLLPGLNHLFQKSSTGSPGEYATIEETMDPTALDAVSGWILERFARHH
jgi:pimeloyl-ACP methyl ester carboxylesterase